MSRIQRAPTACAGHWASSATSRSVKVLPAVSRRVVSSTQHAAAQGEVHTCELQACLGSVC